MDIYVGILRPLGLGPAPCRKPERGPDFSQLIRPLPGTSWIEGPDFRQLICPLPGTSWIEGPDFCQLIRPLPGTSWIEGPDLDNSVPSLLYTVFEQAFKFWFEREVRFEVAHPD